jgi:arylsulfatase A-like enzyme
MGVPQSLVLVTIDCLRADHVGFMGYARAKTPFMDSLAADSTVMKNAIVAGAPTYHSFPAIMASRYPLALGRDVIGVGPEEPTLASTLHQYGYATGAFVAGNPYLSKQFGYASGFDEFKDFLEDSEKEEGSGSRRAQGRLQDVNRHIRRLGYKMGLGWLYDEFYFRYGLSVAARSPKSLDQLRRFPSADKIVGQAANWLKPRSTGGPFFLWLHLMDPHGPYYPPPQALDFSGYLGMNATRALYLNSYWTRSGIGQARLRHLREEVISLYDSAIHWVDLQLEGLVRVLSDLGLWRDCVFVVTADHGEEFLDHGGRAHAPAKVTEELVHVPLLMHFPRMATRRIEAPFSLLHLAPTLLDCLQVPVPADFHGRSHWSLLKAGGSWDGEAIVECLKGCSNPFRKSDRRGRRLLAVREKDHKLVIDFDTRADQLFDLRSDPRELKPLPLAEMGAIRRRLLERARNHIRESLSRRDVGARASLVLREVIRETAAD